MDAKDEIWKTSLLIGLGSVYAILTMAAGAFVVKRLERRSRRRMPAPGWRYGLGLGLVVACAPLLGVGYVVLALLPVGAALGLLCAIVVTFLVERHRRRLLRAV
jgi:hypothetical protein